MSQQQYKHGSYVELEILIIATNWIAADLSRLIFCKAPKNGLLFGRKISGGGGKERRKRGDVGGAAGAAFLSSRPARWSSPRILPTSIRTVREKQPQVRNKSLRYLTLSHRLHSTASVTPTALAEAACALHRPSGAARPPRAPRRSRLISPRARGPGRGRSAGGTRPTARGGAKRAGPSRRSPRPPALWRRAEGAEPRRIPPLRSPRGAGRSARPRARARWLAAGGGGSAFNGRSAPEPGENKTKAAAARSAARPSGCLGRPAALRRGDARRAPGLAYDPPRPPPRAHAALCFRCPSLRAGREGPVRAPRRPPRGVRIWVLLRECGPRRCRARCGAGECSAAAEPCAEGEGENGRGRGAGGATSAGVCVGGAAGQRLVRAGRGPPGLLGREEAARCYL